MKRFVFLAKSRLESAGQGRESRFAFAYAERVRRAGANLLAENLQVPIIERDGGAVRIARRRLENREYQGFAYRVPVPPWFASESAGTAVEVSPELERPDEKTPLGRFLADPEMRRALAQDRIAAEVTAFLGTPDLLAFEDDLIEAWKRDRPEAAAQAADSLARSGPAGPARTRLRLAAYRRIDASATGREIFVSCPEFFGEPYLEHDLPGGFRLKAGIVRSVSYRPTHESEALSLRWRADENLVRAVESRLLPPITTEREAEDLAEIWLPLAPLRAFEASSPLPLFPCETAFPEGHVPPGYRLRFKNENLRGLGASLLTLVATGVSPYVAECFEEYCVKNHAEISPSQT